MNHDIKLVAVDIDGTFVRSDYTYDIPALRGYYPTWRTLDAILLWPAEINIIS